VLAFNVCLLLTSSPPFTSQPQSAPTSFCLKSHKTSRIHGKLFIYLSLFQHRYLCTFYISDFHANFLVLLRLMSFNMLFEKLRPFGVTGEIFMANKAGNVVDE
jgi:hypothetical protein